jgi:hypothetical protein
MIWVGLLSCLLTFGCRIRSTGPHWTETHGRGELTRLAGGSAGLLAIGTNGLVYRYPESGTWREWSAQFRPLAITGSRDGLLYSERGGRVGSARQGRVAAPTWTLNSDVTDLASDGSGDHAYAIADGRISQLLPSGQLAAVCPNVHAVGIAFAQGKLWLSDGQRLYVATENDCTAAGAAPERVIRLSGFADRLFVVDALGDVLRRMKDGSWQKLPRPMKFRADRMPQEHPVTDVAVTSTATWVLDDERTVFVLSESE